MIILWVIYESNVRYSLFNILLKKLFVYANFDSPMDFSTINTKVLKKLDFYIKLVSQTISKEKKNQLSNLLKIRFYGMIRAICRKAKGHDKQS